MNPAAPTPLSDSPQYTECPACLGAGELGSGHPNSPAFRASTCPFCNGAGEVTLCAECETHDLEANPVAHGFSACEVCLAKARRCPLCHGSKPAAASLCGFCAARTERMTKALDLDTEVLP